MIRRAAALLAAGLAASGCKTPDDRRPKDRADAQAKPAGRSWLDGPPGPKLAEVGVPKADTWADPRDPGYDQARDVQGVLTGYVEYPDGRKARDVFIEVELAGGDTGGAPKGVYTDRDGFFLIKGLKPDQAFQLTVRGKYDGKDAAGRVFVRTGTPAAQRVRLPLVENMTLPAGPGGTPTSGPTAPDDRPPRDTPAAATKPEPKPVGPAPPSGGGEPADPPPPRPEYTTDGPPTIPRPPVTNIGRPGLAAPPARESRSVPADRRFTLLAPDGDAREFPGPGLVLLDFMTTTCLPCKKARPAVEGIQGRYGLKGLEVVAVACDEVNQSARQAVAGKYQRESGLNHLVYVEPGDRPGPLGKRFGVTGYPTLVLLDAAGAVLWQGHPNDAAELERAVRDGLPR